MIRADLLALTPDALAALANRGLVKRAAKELDAGNGPEVDLTPDGTVRGRFPDGAEATLPGGGGLEGGSCTCAATGVCRHRIGLILAYQRQAAGAATTAVDPVTAEAPASGAEPRPAEVGTAAVGTTEAVLAEPGTVRPDTVEVGATETRAVESGDAAAAPAAGDDTVPDPAGSPSRAAGVAWSPGAFDDEALARTLGQRALTAARRTHRAGYTARVRRPTAADPVASVELPTCTVRFLVPGELGYVHIDAAAALRGEVIALAVWAFRAADERGLQGDDVRVDVGGRPGGTVGEAALEAAVRLVDDVLLDGAVHAGPLQPAALRRASRELAARNLHWPAAALDGLTEQLTAYRDRAARYAPETLALLLAEVHARHRAARHGGGLPRAQVLGTDESADTPLRQVRLTALGCRVGGTDDERTAEVFLAHPDSGVVLVLKRRWEVTEGQVLTGGDLASRRILGSPLRALAAANVVSENASRSAGRVVRMTAGRVSRTTITPVGTAWQNLPESVLVRDLGALDRAVAALPPGLIRPRVEAELVRVVEVVAVHEVGYDPGDQRLEAVIADATGTTATVSAVHSPYRPGALDGLAEALKGHATGPLLLSGSVSRAGGRLVLDPIAVLTGGTVIVPDLLPGSGGEALDPYAGRRTNPLGAALDDALAACAEAAHRGLRHATAGVRTRLDNAAQGLRRVGLRTAAGLLTALAAALCEDDPDRMVAAWVDAQLRLATTAELR